jgi:GWxTD domain-containing protein
MKVMMKIRFVLSLLLLSCCILNLIAAEKLGMFIEVKRYLDEKYNTKYDIDYQVPYKNLMFQTRGNTFYAELKVIVSIANADSVLMTKEFTNNIGVTRKYDVTTSSKSYLDRISLTLAKPGYILNLSFTDINSGKTFEWSYTTEQLSLEDKLSDMELLSAVTADTLSYSNKFLRNGLYYVPEPSGLVSRELHDSIFFYCEAYGIKSSNARAVLTLLRGETPVLIKTYNFTRTSGIQRLLYPVAISALDIGSYNAVIELSDNESIYSRSYELVITEQTEQMYFIFADLEDDYQLLKYISVQKNANNWKTMSKEAKRRYISSFWAGLAAMNNQSPETLLKKYKDRVDYSNSHFSHFSKGWISDMGRIYIRNGSPTDTEGDVESLTSSDDTKFVRKDYQIWKYSGHNKAVYLFVDVQMNGNFKLVYARNDEQESTYPDWRKYLGSDFDESVLEN